MSADFSTRPIQQKVSFFSSENACSRAALPRLRDGAEKRPAGVSRVRSQRVKVLLFTFLRQNVVAVVNGAHAARRSLAPHYHHCHWKPEMPTNQVREAARHRCAPAFKTRVPEVLPVAARAAISHQPTVRSFLCATAPNVPGSDAPKVLPSLC